MARAPRTDEANVSGLKVRLTGRVDRAQRNSSRPILMVVINQDRLAETVVYVTFPRR